MDSEVADPTGIARLFTTGDAHCAAGLYDLAVDEYRAALLREPQMAKEDSIRVRIDLADCLRVMSRCQESKQVLQPMLEREFALPVSDLPRVLARLGWAHFFLGDLETCLSMCDEACSMLLPTDQHDELAQVLRWTGYAFLRKGDVDNAGECFRDGLAAAKRGTDRSQLGYGLEALGHFCQLTGDYDAALSNYESSRRLNEELGETRNLAADCHHIGLVKFYLGDWSGAHSALDRALRKHREVAHDRGAILAMLGLSRLLRRQDRPDLSEEYARRARSLAQDTGYRRATVLASEELADLAADAGDLERAFREAGAALLAAREIAPQGDLVYELCWRMARISLKRHALGEAEDLADEAIRLAAKSSDRRELGHGLATMAMVRADQARFAEARGLVQRAIDEFRSIQTPYELAQTHEIAAGILRKEPKPVATEILGHLFEARRLYGRLGAAKASDRVGKELEAVEASLHPDAVEPEDPTKLPARDVLILADESMKKLVATAERAGRLPEWVLIEGETGTGKELIARLIHESGPRAVRPFVAVNCAAMPENLLESQLFGHRRGAFTGAVESHIGLLPSARSGTVFLDEIDKSTVEFQAKLLRVLDERAVRPLGSVKTVPLQARIICASNRDLRELAESRTFLPDLYFRIATIMLQIPPLRERPEDVTALIEHFLRKCDGRFGPEHYEISQDAEYALIAYDWPGNVRELRNVVERAAFFAHETGRIELEHLPQDMREGKEAGNPEATLPDRIASFERRHIVAAMRKAKGVKSEAARVLGVSRKGLGDRLRRLGLE